LTSIMTPPVTQSPTSPASNAVDVTPTAVLLMGAPGAGKTDALATIIEAGLELFVLGTEPRFVESLLDSLKRRSLPIDRLHWCTVEPVKIGFAAMINNAKLVNQMSFETLSQIKSGMEKASHGQFIKVLENLANFRDERTGQSFGSVDSWGPDRALAVDSLSGLNIMAKDLVVGGKPTAAQGEWGVAMDSEERLINKLSADTRCLFVLTAHVEREPDEITGGSNVVVGALGRKLAPRIPRFFSEVVLARREADKYYWSTTTTSYELKKRVLPLSDKIEPSFKPIIDAWRARLATAGGK